MDSSSEAKSSDDRLESLLSAEEREPEEEARSSNARKGHRRRKVSTRRCCQANAVKEWSIIGLSGISVFLTGGLVFGFSSLYPVLYSERAFENKCSAGAREGGCPSNEACCSSQRLWLTLLASCALFSADAVMVFYGEANDRLGPATCLVVGSLLVFFGFQAVVLALSFDEGDSKNISFFIGLVAMGLGGPGVFMGCISFGSAYPKIEPKITAACAAMWDTSSVVFLIFASAYKGHFTTFLEGWAIFGLGVAGLTTFLLRRAMRTLEKKRKRQLSMANYTTPRDDASLSFIAHPNPFRGGGSDDESSDSDDDSSNSFAGEVKRDDYFLPSTAPETSSLENVTVVSPTTENTRNLSGGSDDGTQRPRIWPLLLRRDTVGLVLFMALYNLKSAFYIESVSDEIRSFLSAPSARRLDLTFDLAFPLGGLVTSLFSATLLDKYQDRDDVVFCVVALFANAFSILQLAPFEATQYAAAILFGPARTFQWAAYFHLLCNPKGRYPENVGGRLIGYGNLAIATVGDGLPYALTAFVNNNSLSTMANYAIVHTILAIAIFAASIDFYLLLLREQQQRARNTTSGDSPGAYHRLNGGGGGGANHASGLLAHHDTPDYSPRTTRNPVLQSPKE